MGMGDSLYYSRFPSLTVCRCDFRLLKDWRSSAERTLYHKSQGKIQRLQRKLIKRKVKVITIFTSELQFKFFNRHVFCSRSSIVDPSILPTWTYNTLGVTGTSRSLIVETVGYENEWTIRYGLPLFQVFSCTPQYILMAMFSVKQWNKLSNEKLLEVIC